MSWELLEEGWIQLFDGETLFGWQPAGEAQWDVVDGEVRTSGEQFGFLMSTTEWADYELHVEFRAPASTNSGVFLRTAASPTDPASDCYELNVAPRENPFPTGGLVARQKAKLPADKFPAADQWHTFDVTADGDQITVVLDGDCVLEYRDPAPRRIGHIGLQSREGPVAFRNLRLRPLGVKPLFNGRDLAGWCTDRARECRFEVTEAGELHVVDGPGEIETDGDFANFVLQLECNVNGDRLNSGVFFRTLREGYLLGYESQIDNDFTDGDRTQPEDYGTGGIYRRQHARRVVTDDRTWFAKTIVADGPHMAVWVNGYQVSDWTDDRPPSENPREGRRLGPGTIAFQGHDPTTNLLFRNIRAVELPRN